MAEESREIRITYETLFDLLRREKNRADLQPLEKTFFRDVLGYLTEKVNALETLQSPSGIIAENAEREQTRLQLENVRKILRELYERRERKIVTLAMNKSRTGSEIVNSAALLKEEAMFFDELVSVFNRYREGIVSSILRLNEPNVEPAPGKSEQVAALAAQMQGNDAQFAEDKRSRVIFVSRVDEFVGPELAMYGPFQPDDEAELPRQIADILVKKGHAELV